MVAKTFGPILIGVHSICLEQITQFVSQNVGDEMILEYCISFFNSSYHPCNFAISGLLIFDIFNTSCQDYRCSLLAYI